MSQKTPSNFQAVEQIGVHVTDSSGKPLTKDYVWTPNRVVDQGLNYLLNAAFRGEGVISTFFLAPFAAAITPPANTTGANFAASLTEFTNYSEPNRVLWSTDGPSTAMELINDTSPSLFTIASGAQTTIAGVGMLTAQAKGSTQGLCMMAGRLPNSLLNLALGFEVRLKYRLRATSAA